MERNCKKEDMLPSLHAVSFKIQIRGFHGGERFNMSMNFRNIGERKSGKGVPRSSRHRGCIAEKQTWAKVRKSEV